MIYFYKGTRQNTGSAGQVWYSTSERGFFFELLKQSGWDQSKGPNGVGLFKESKKDPKKRILIKLKLEEVTEVLNVLDANRYANQYNAVVNLDNAKIQKASEAIKEANKALIAEGKTPMVAPLKKELMPLASFSGYHRTAKNNTQIFLKPWDKDPNQYVLQLIKQDAEDKTDSGKTSISILLKPSESRYLQEYLLIGTRDILVYRPPEDKGEKVNIPAEEESLTSEEIVEPEQEGTPVTKTDEAPF